MLYRLFINYLRLRLLKHIITRLTRPRPGKQNLKSMGILAYLLEFAATFLLDGKKKSRKK